MNSSSFSALMQRVRNVIGEIWFGMRLGFSLPRMTELRAEDIEKALRW